MRRRRCRWRRWWACSRAALRLLSPFMPFLTEEIWHALYGDAVPAKSIALTRYPQAADFPADAGLSARDDDAAGVDRDGARPAEGDGGSGEGGGADRAACARTAWWRWRMRTRTCWRGWRA